MISAWTRLWLLPKTWLNDTASSIILKRSKALNNVEETSIEPIVTGPHINTNNVADDHEEIQEIFKFGKYRLMKMTPKVKGEELDTCGKPISFGWCLKGVEYQLKKHPNWGLDHDVFHDPPVEWKFLKDYFAEEIKRKSLRYHVDKVIPVPLFIPDPPEESEEIVFCDPEKEEEILFYDPDVFAWTSPNTFHEDRFGGLKVKKMTKNSGKAKDRTMVLRDPSIKLVTDLRKLTDHPTLYLQ